MAQQDDDASELHEAEEVVCVILPACYDSAKVLKPGEEPFDLPATSAAPQRSTILRLLASIAAVRRNQLDVALLKPRIKSITVVGSVTDQPLRIIRYHRVQRVF